MSYTVTKETFASSLQLQYTVSLLEHMAHDFEQLPGREDLRLGIAELSI